MKRFLIIPVMVLLAVAGAFSQVDNSAEITKIRGFYTSVSNEIKKIEKDEEAALQSELAVNELVVNKLNKSWPAVGNYSVVYRFYYKQAGEEPYPDRLVLVSKKTTSAAREYYEEFLFSEKGDLVFLFIKEADGKEHRGYFANGNLAQYLGNGDPAAKELLAALGSTAGKLKQMFELSIDSV